MSQVYLLVAFAYAVFTVTLVSAEIYRTRATGPDAISVFAAIFVLQCCLPGIGIYSLLPFVDREDATGNYFFDGVFERLDLTKALLVLALTIWFAVFAYLGAFGGRLVLRRLFPGASYRLEGIEYRLVLVLLGGLAFTLISFFLSGEDMTERYANLIRLRAYSEEFERTTLNAYAFELTQTWGWLAIPALFIAQERRARGFVWWLFLFCAIIFAVLGVSRRAFFIPIMLCYFTLLLYDGKWRVRAIIAIAVPTVILIAYGKEFLATIAFGGAVADLSGRYGSFAAAMLRASSEQGITIVESLGTLTFLDDHWRLGADHLLSIARKFPFRLLGWDAELPKRIVRISTEAFASPDAQDIPPGLMGQMWLDFRVLGPVAWGLFIGIQLSVVQFMYERWQRNLQSSALVALIVFLIALPINTGSYDFTISIDVIVTMIALVLVFRSLRVGDTR